MQTAGGRVEVGVGFGFELMVEGGVSVGMDWAFSAPLPTIVLCQVHFAMKDYGDVDRWIAQLMECKPLSEAEVVQLCARVTIPI
jgi:hypothetical protein